MCTRTPITSPKLTLLSLRCSVQRRMIRCGKQGADLAIFWDQQLRWHAPQEQQSSARAKMEVTVVVKALSLVKTGAITSTVIAGVAAIVTVIVAAIIVAVIVTAILAVIVVAAAVMTTLLPGSNGGCWLCILWLGGRPHSRKADENWRGSDSDRPPRLLHLETMRVTLKN